MARIVPTNVVENVLPEETPVLIRHYVQNSEDMQRNIYSYLRYMDDAMTKYSRGSKERQYAFDCALNIYNECHQTRELSQEWETHFFNVHMRFEKENHNSQ
jgi:hypothetical protein